MGKLDTDNEEFVVYKLGDLCKGNRIFINSELLILVHANAIGDHVI